jgi:nucleoid DNA-binding protein
VCHFTPVTKLHRQINETAEGHFTPVTKLHRQINETAVRIFTPVTKLRRQINETAVRYFTPVTKLCRQINETAVRHFTPVTKLRRKINETAVCHFTPATKEAAVHFVPLQQHYGGRRFLNNKEAETVVRQWWCQKEPNFYWTETVNHSQVFLALCRKTLIL